jgi:hypothetical protein
MSNSKSPATLAARGALKTDQLGRQVIEEASFQEAFTQAAIYAELSERCDFGSVNAQMYTCVTGHTAFLRCAKCGMHRARLSHQTITFITEIINRFGRPTAPIKIRRGEADQKNSETAEPECAPGRLAGS